MFIGEVVDSVESGQVVSTRDVGQGGQEGGAGQGVHSGHVVSTRELDSGQEVDSGQVQVEGV